MQRFRLTDGRGQISEFNSEIECLSKGLNSAYLAFCQGSPQRELVLEVFHGGHGWQPVYNSRGYCQTIINPFSVDYKGLKRDIHNTLSIVNTWPTRKQLLQGASEQKQLQSNQRAVARRAAFRVYLNPLNNTEGVHPQQVKGR